MKVKLNNTGMNKNENKIVRISMKYITGILIMCDCVCVSDDLQQRNLHDSQHDEYSGQLMSRISNERKKAEKIN